MNSIIETPTNSSPKVHETLNLSEFPSNLRVPARTILKAHSLFRIAGSITLEPESALLAPNLAFMDGNIEVSEYAHLELNAVTEIANDVLLRPAAEIFGPNIQHIGGSLTAGQLSKAYLPLLSSIKSDLSVDQGAQVHLPSLQTISGMLGVEEGTYLALPRLSTIEATLNLGEWSHLHAPLLAIVGEYVILYQGAKTQTASLATINGHSIASADAGRRLLRQIADSILEDEDDIDMNSWPLDYSPARQPKSIGAWAIRHSGKAGLELLKQIGAEATANVLLGLEASAYLNLSDEIALIVLRTSKAANNAT